LAHSAAKLNRNARDQKKSVLRSLTDRQADLFRLLAAKSWNDERPALRTEVRRLLEDKNAEKLYNMASDWMESWDGQISREGLIKFVSNGYLARGELGGFTIFAFFTKSSLEPSTKDHERAIRNALGDTKVTDEMIKEFSKKRHSLPMTVDEAASQLDTGVRFLDKMTRENGIASEGYRYGRTFILEHRREFLQELTRDKLFMVCFLFTLDSVFQDFLRRLVHYREERRPIRAARHELRRFMKRSIDDIMRHFHLNHTPDLRLPTAITTADNPAPQGPGERTKEKKGGKEPNPPWWSKNPSRQEKHKLPEGKTMKMCWSFGDEKAKENIMALPKVKHHRLNRTCSLCATYTVNGECRESCRFAHVPYDKLSAKDAAQLDKAIVKAHSA